MSIRSAQSTTAGDGEVATRATVGESAGNGKIPHLSLRERAARGKAERAEVPRSVHGEWSAPAGRRDPVELLEEQAASRVPELVPIRYGRMLVSPFTFYRGAAYLMAADLAGSQRTGLRVQLCGDAHLSNFGGFAAPDRRLVFDINDFDETLPGPFEWDLKRLVASFAVAGRDLGFPVKQRRTVNVAVTRAYREAIRGLAGDEDARSVVLAGRCRGDARPVSERGKREAPQADGEEPRQDTGEGQPAGVQQAHDDRRRRAADRQRPAADRADRGSRRRPRRREVRASGEPRLPTHAARAIANTCWSASATCTRRARSSVSAVSAPARGSC